MGNNNDCQYLKARDRRGNRPMSPESMDEPIDVALPPTLKATRQGATAHLRLSRAEKRNALDHVTVRGLEAFFAGLPEGIRAVVMSGEGPHFSAGLDLSEIVDE